MLSEPRWRRESRSCISEAAKELAVGETVRFDKAKSFKIRGLAAKVTAYPAEKAAREVEADAAP